MNQAEKGRSEEEMGKVEREISYGRYRELGGIINEEDYRQALKRAGETTSLRKPFVLQAEQIAKRAGVPLNNTGGLDEVTILYGVLRTDIKPGAEYHHGQMRDQRLFAEVLRMLDRPDWLEKVIAAYPNIVFD